MKAEKEERCDRDDIDGMLAFCGQCFRHPQPQDSCLDDDAGRSRCGIPKYLSKRTADVRSSVMRREMAGNPVKSRDVANFIGKK